MTKKNYVKFLGELQKMKYVPKYIAKYTSCEQQTNVNETHEQNQHTIFILTLESTLG